MSNSPYLSASELAVLLRRSGKSIYQLLAKGEIAGSFRIGSEWYIDREMFLASLKEKASRSKAPAYKPGPRGRHGL